MALQLQGVFTNKRNRMEMMLFKKKQVWDNGNDVIVECPTEEWIALWESYTKEDRKVRSTWRLSNYSFYNIKAYDEMISNLKKIKKLRPDIFREIFEKEFVMGLMCELVKSQMFVFDGKWNRPLDVQKFVTFVKKNLKETCEETDMWGKLNQEIFGNDVKMIMMWDVKELVSFITLWKHCFLQKVYIDLTKMFDLKNAILQSFLVFDVVRKGQETFDQKNRFMLFLQTIDGFKDCEKYFLEGYDICYLEDFVKLADQELMYVALKKNFINLCLVNKVIELAAKEEKLDLMPLLILKKNGEWPEEELFAEST